jgi:ISXO2-like transposase domain
MAGFWGLVKRAWYGQHHHYSQKYAPLYIGEAYFKYNTRKHKDTFANAIGLMVTA